MTEKDIEDWYNYALYLTKECGKMMLDAFYKEKIISTKQTFADLVTESDKAIQDFIFNSVKAKYENHNDEKAVWSDSPTWIVDPIDGTTNFIHQFPNSAVSVGVSLKKKIVIGMVFNPMQNLFYSAMIGKGAFCNNKPIHVSNIKDLNKALIFTEVGSLRKENVLDKKLENYAQLAKSSHGIRSLGSAALNMCSIASGQGDGGFEFGIHIWDIAAGALIVTEAGGVVLDPTGNELDMLSRKFMAAANIELAKQISSKIINQVEFERD